MAMSFGPYIFPLNPTNYQVPAVKEIDVAYAIDDSLLTGNPLYNQNEFSLTWSGVINDFNGIVVYLKNFIKNEYVRNRKDDGPKMFSDGVGLFRGLATLVGANCSIRKSGGAIVYDFVLVFRYS